MRRLARLVCGQVPIARSHVQWVFGVVVVAYLLAGCASVPMAPTTADDEAKTFGAVAGKARLYIFRPDAFRLSAVTVNVTMNGTEFGLLKVGTYLHAVLEPGRYTLVSRSFQEVPVVLIAEADHQYFFQQVVEDAPIWASGPRSTLIRVDEAVGRREVSDGEMAASNPATPSSEPACVRDADCKAERICVAGTCTAN